MLYETQKHWYDIYKDFYMNKHTTSIVGFGILGSILAYNLATAWVGPSAAAPNNNATPPVNVGSTAQTKAGSFGLTGSLIVAGSSSFGSGNAPAAFIDIGSNTATQRQAIFTRGADANFRIIAQNGSATNASGQEVGRFGLEYNGSGWNSGLRFIRGGGALDGSIAVDTNGTERIRIDSAGNVGIGTTAPGGELDVWGGAGGRFIRVNPNDTGYLISSYNSSASNAEQFNIRHNLSNTELRNERGNINFPIGNVGIGTTAPGTRLDVAGTIRSTSGGFTFPDGTTQTTAATGGNYIQNQTAAAQSAANFRIAGSGRFVGGYGALGISGATELAVGAGGTSPNAASIAFGDNSGWKLNIGTNVASVFTPRVTIQDNNRFGINNGTPSYIFDVGGAGSGAVTARLTNDNSIVRLNGVDLLGYSNTNMWLIGNSSSSELNLGTAWDWDRQAAIQYTPGTVGAAGGQLAIGQIQKNAATWTHGFTTLYTNGAERVRVNSAGNVGIGTSSPGYRLDVAGDIQAQGWLRTSGNVGWYSQSYGGGWYMTDSTWIRSYGSKNIYHDTGIMRTDGTLQVGSGGATLYATNGGNVGIKLNPSVAHFGVNGTGLIGGANQGTYDIGAGRIAAGDAVYSYGRLCAGNSSGDCTGTGGVVISGANIRFPDASTLSSANGLWNQDAVVFRTSLMANGIPPLRTTSTAFMNVASVYGPFGYATPGCPAGKTRRFKLFAELVDNITNGGQNVEFRINFTSATDLVFNLGSTWGGSSNHRTWLSSAFADPGTGDHASIEVRINGTAGPYVEMRNAELWTVCQ
jgi:hypothetical protein